MTSLSPEIWEKLAASRPHGQSLSARIAVPDVCNRLLAALDAEGRRHFLIGVTNGYTALADKQSRGVQVETRDMIVSGRESSQYIDIVCVDPVGHDVFQLIGGELVDRLQQKKDAAESIRQVLAKWRRFWGQLPKDILSRSDQIGLFAEVWFLSHWMIPAVGPKESVGRWRGPLRARHDFEWWRASVEVKATISAQGTTHHINGIEQLSLPEYGALFLFSLLLRDEAGAHYSLPLVIDECRHKLEADSETLSEFESKLIQAGYSPAHDEEYSKLHVRIAHETLYAVREDFPRLIPSSLVNGVPPGVEHVGYDINTSGFDHLIVGREELFSTTDKSML